MLLVHNGFVGGSGSLSNYVCFSLSYIWIPESPPTWERAADFIYYLSYLFTDVNLYFRGLTCGFLLPRIFNVVISVSPHVCFNLDLILITFLSKIMHL